MGLNAITSNRPSSQPDPLSIRCLRPQSARANPIPLAKSKNTEHGNQVSPQIKSAEILADALVVTVLEPESADEILPEPIQHQEFLSRGHRSQQDGSAYP